MSISAALQAELEKSNPRINKSVAFALPDGTTLRVSDVALCSVTLGFHEPVVKKFGVIDHPGADSQCSLQVPRWTGFLMIDVERAWQTLAAKYKLKGIIATLTVSSPNVAVADWLVIDFAVDDWEYPEEGLVGVSFQPPFHEVLVSPLPLGRIFDDDFPDMPTEARDLYYMLGPWGQHDSFGIGTVDGTIMPVLVDTVNNRYLLAFGGAIEKVLHAFGDGVRFVPTAWELLQVDINGKSFVLVQFDNDQSAKQITVDVRGFTEDGVLGTGAALDRPMKALRHALANVVYNETTDALTTNNGWVGDADTPINPDYFDETDEYLSQRTPQGYRTSLYVAASASQQTGVGLLNGCCQTHQVMPFYTLLNLLAVRPDSMDDVGYLDSPWIQRPLHELDTGPLQPSDPTDDMVGVVMVEGNTKDPTGTVQERLQVNAQPPDRASDTIASPWGEAYI